MNTVQILDNFYVNYNNSVIMCENVAFRFTFYSLQCSKILVYKAQFLKNGKLNMICPR